MIKTYTNKDGLWIDAAGNAVPYKFVPQVDKNKERFASRLYAAATAVEKALAQLHAEMHDATRQVTALVKQEYAIKQGKEKKQGKGSITWYNFNKTLKIEADVNDIVKWDSALMTEALQLLNQYLSGSLTDAQQLIKEMVADGFSNSKGMIDSRRIFQLLKYERKIKDKRFLQACELIKQAQSVDTTKLYMRIWEKDDKGGYRNINLNFSSL